MNDFTSPPLATYLERKNTLLAGKAVELRRAIGAWLEYVPQTFPHYTRHTLQHSDEIIAQLSKLLFRGGDSATPVIQLSGAEAYILIVSAYLHDAGMVTPESEKVEILGSDEWREWVSQPGQVTRWEEIAATRNRDKGDGCAHFIADILTRRLIAEFVRPKHHIRSADLIGQLQDQLGHFALNDPMLLRTIQQVCAAHGLSSDQLDDREAFPDLRDVLHDQVNVRLMAILLRLGDLLDLSTDRACPLSQSAASPLPAESYAHWSQYRRIVQKAITPEAVELIAECEQQDEHRILQDWCQWLVNETASARRLLIGSRRHGEWQPPLAEFAENSIQIRPSKSATYIPLDWKFELDPDQVLARLIHDTYPASLAFVRELVQNALDATRCKVAGDLQRQGLEVPVYMCDLNDNTRTEYPVTISLGTRVMRNALSGVDEERQILGVADRGIGMSADIVQRYLLQVGRSYYVSEEFRRRYGFVPTSRYGVGFLSVFSASDHVTVDTRMAGAPDGLRLTLNGPRKLPPD